MSGAFIVDAHAHIGRPGAFFAPETEPEALLKLMDQLDIERAVCMDHLSVCEGCERTLTMLRDVFERSGGRLHYLAVFNPKRSSGCMAALKQAMNWPGFAGLKIHPSFHGVSAEDARYEPAWRFAAERDVPILTHSWSVSDYNPVQQLSTPGRFEPRVGKFPKVRLVLGHAGGRGTGRHEALRMARDYANVFLDLAGDIFCYRLIESLVDSVPAEKILFGSDAPWLDPRSRLSHVLLADVPAPAKAKILRENALRVYRIGAKEKC